MTSMVGMYMEFKAKSTEVDSTFNRMNKEIDDLKAKQNSANAGFDKMTSLIKQVGAAFLSWQAVKGVFNLFRDGLDFINQTADSIDKVTNSARELGIGATALQQLQFAAGQSGVSVEELNMLLKKMNLTIGQVANGTKKLTFFDTSSLLGKNTEEQMTTILKNIEQIPDKNLQAAASFEVFGKQGNKALSLVRDGFSENIAVFNKLGVSLSDAQRKSVDAYGDSKRELETLFSGFGSKLTAYLSPFFTNTVKWIEKVVLEMGGMDEVANKFGQAIVDAMDWAASATKTLLNGVLELYKIFIAVRGATYENEISDLQKEAEQEQKIILGPNGETIKANYVTGVSSGEDANKEGQSELPNISRFLRIDELKQQQATDEARFNKADQWENTITKRQQEYSQVIKETTPALADTKDAAGNITDSFEKLAKASDKVQNSFEEYFKKLGGSDSSGIIKAYEAKQAGNTPDKGSINDFNSAGADFLTAYRQYSSAAKDSNYFDQQSYKEMLAASDKMDDIINTLQSKGIDTQKLEATKTELGKYGKDVNSAGIDLSGSAGGYSNGFDQWNHSPTLDNKSALAMKDDGDMLKAISDTVSKAIDSQQIKVIIEVKAEDGLFAKVAASQQIKDAVNSITDNSLKYAAMSGAK